MLLFCFLENALSSHHQTQANQRDNKLKIACIHKLKRSLDYFFSIFFAVASCLKYIYIFSLSFRKISAFPFVSFVYIFFHFHPFFHRIVSSVRCCRFYSFVFLLCKHFRPTNCLPFAKHVFVAQRFSLFTYIVFLFIQRAYQMITKGFYAKYFSSIPIWLWTGYKNQWKKLFVNGKCVAFVIPFIHHFNCHLNR